MKRKKFDKYVNEKKPRADVPADDEAVSIRKLDWRIQSVTTLKEDFRSPWTGKVHKKGARVTGGTGIKYDEHIIGITLPNPAALFISSAWEASSKANAYFSKKFLKVASTSSNTGQLRVEDRNISEHFDYIEMIFTSVVFSFSAIEAHCNEMIPDEYMLVKTRNDKKCTETYDKNQIEKYVSLNTKIAEVIPPIMDVDSPKGTMVWQNYKKIKDLRDRIIHLKSEDLKPSDSLSVDDYLWTDMVHKDVFMFPKYATDLLSYFYTKTDPPRWLSRLAIEFSKTS